jgi:hypothetical protein
MCLAAAIASTTACSKDDDAKEPETPPVEENVDAVGTTLSEVLSELRSSVRMSSKAVTAALTDQGPLALQAGICAIPTDNSFGPCFESAAPTLKQVLESPKDFLNIPDDERNGINIIYIFENDMFFSCLVAVSLDATGKVDARGYPANGNYTVKLKSLDAGKVAEACGSTKASLEQLTASPMELKVTVADTKVKTTYDKAFTIEVPDDVKTRITLLARYKKEGDLNILIRQAYANGDCGTTGYNSLSRTVVQKSAAKKTTRMEYRWPTPLTGGSNPQPIGSLAARLFIDEAKGSGLMFADQWISSESRDAFTFGINGDDADSFALSYVGQMAEGRFQTPRNVCSHACGVNA